jgi:hypothetical protein
MKRNKNLRLAAAYFKGLVDWETYKTWQPPLNTEEFEEYCKGWDYVLEEDPILGVRLGLYGFNDFPDSL